MKPRHPRDRLLNRRVRAFERALPEACGGDAAAVHKARVASRRVREALPVVLANIPAKKAKRLARGFRRITAALGPVREADVTLNVLEATAGRVPEAAASLQRVAQDLLAERDRRRLEMLGRLENVDAERLVTTLDTIAAMTAAQPPVVAQSVSRAVLAVRIVRRVRNLQDAMSAAGALYAPEPLHAVRIATKKLRYALELAHEFRLLPSRRPLRQLERMQDTLGQLHDFQVLVERLASAQAALPDTESAVAADLSRVTAALENDCRALHAAYVSGRDSLAAVIAEALETVTAAPVRDVETEPVSPSVH
jgi:CHAD domain-containing protein